MKVLAFVVSSFLFSYTYAAVSTCTEKYEIFDNNTQVQVLASGDNCYVSVHPRSAFEDMVYRDYMFDNHGLFMVFDSYGEGPESQTTAARNFSFFPMNSADLGYTYDAAVKRLAVTTVSGKVFTFNTEKAVLVSVSGSDITQNYTIRPENKGGIEFVKNDGLYMEGGFKRGQSPSQNPKNAITFKDAQQNSCQLYNADVYRYTTDDDAIFKLTDAQLKTLINTRCPQLIF